MEAVMRIPLHLMCAAACSMAFAVATTGLAAAAPATGDVHVYQRVNGYNNETRGKLTYQVARVEGDRITVSVTPDNPEAGRQRTEVFTREGNWLAHEVENHGHKVHYEFAEAYPAFVFPLEQGKSWSIRVKATVPDEQRPRSVRVDGKVVGTERIRVPAGEFDTIKVKRTVYPGDHAFMLSETYVMETDWYAPALGRVVRTERDSRFLDLQSCAFARCEARGDWDIYELVESRPAKR
jgi:hypothetical protein